MKRRLLVSAWLGTLFLLASALSLHAQFVWSGGSTGNGSDTDPTNWQGGVSPSGVSGTEDVSFGDISGTQTNVLVATSGLHNITFNGSSRPPTRSAAAAPRPHSHSLAM